MKKTYLFLLVLLGCITHSFAQVSVKGKVISQADNMPIPGATIMLQGTTKSTLTDFDGNFVIESKEKTGVLAVSSLGFKTKATHFSGEQVVEISLEVDASNLEEIVLIGYGSSKKGDLTSAIAKVENIESINSRPVNKLSDFLQGNVPGVTVFQNGGDPTSSPKVSIRGIGSINSGSEQVLTIVDGVPYFGPAINPNDIASVSVLKDAAAASIYGAQAGSGVIVIETKKGKIGKPRISIDAYTGFSQATNLPTPLNAKQQADAYNQATDNAGVGRITAHDAVQNPWGQVTRTNWMDAIFRNAQTKNVNANISGAGKKFNYLTSFSYNSKEGVLLGTKSDRFTFRVKSDFDVTDKITIGENVYFSRDEALGTNTSSGYSGSIINAIYMPSAAPVRDENGNFHGTAPFDLSNFAGAYGDVYNPAALLLRPTKEAPATFISANINGKYKILEGLTFRTNFTYTSNKRSTKEFMPKVPELGRTSTLNYLNQGNSEENTWILENQLGYKKSFGDHHIQLTAIQSAQSKDYESTSVRGEGFDSEESFNQYIGNADLIRYANSGAREEKLTSLIGRAMYNYGGRYFASVSARQDESSRLFKDNQSDEFYSATLGWKISSENFFKSDFVNSLKLRASWGEIGNINAADYYSFNVPLSRANNVILGAAGLQSSSAIYQRTLPNTDLKWERSESIDFGVDATMFDNALSITADYFEKTTKDMHLDGGAKVHLGKNVGIRNIGEVLNRGLEFAVNYKNNIGGLKYSVNANAFSLLENKLVHLNDAATGVSSDFRQDGSSVRGGVLTPFRSGVGEELFSNYLIPYAGIFQNQAEIDAHAKDGNPIQPNAVPGDFKFEDTNNDGKINADDRVYMGSYQPDLTYNLGLNLDYKGFDLGLIFQGVSGSKAFNAYKYTTYNAALQGYNLDNRVLNAWTPTNTNTDIPRLSTRDNNNNFGRNSSWYLEDASYLRLKNITLGYSLSKKLMNKMAKGSSLRFYVSAENVFTITDYTGLDPEVGGKGLDVGQYPVSRTITGGLSLKL